MSFFHSFSSLLIFILLNHYLQLNFNCVGNTNVMLKIHCHTETARMRVHFKYEIVSDNLQPTLFYQRLYNLWVSILSNACGCASWQDNNRPQNSPSERGSLNTARTGRKVYEKYKHIRKWCISTFLLPSLSPLFSQHLLISQIKSSYHLLLYSAACALHCIMGTYFGNES